METVIKGWARAISLRNNEDEGHTERVTEMTMRMAQAIGMTKVELMNARLGALLHDIGKIGVPEKILQKPSKLTDDEWKIMRKHPEYAYELLSSIPYLQPALEIPYCHHEKWDGTGFPRGLSAEQIPLAARIFAIVDVHDALTTTRTYRTAWTIDRTLAYIREKAGQAFDPALIETFLMMQSASK